MGQRILVAIGLASALGWAGAQSTDPEIAKTPTFPDFACPPEAEYCNQASEAGMQIVRRYGRGTAVADINLDGWDDVFMADSDNRWDERGYGLSMFFVNKKDGTFAAIPATALGIADRDLVATWNGSFGDYDNDGDPDLLIANGGYSATSNLALYENRIPQSEGFVSVTDPSGIGILNDSPSGWW
ncbi:MAG: VCBS repeat-containing protein, partial [Rubricoccaceae bacterium]|nr:VCBS repeat-containing protein [Rubricoccaceae bacterium]